MALSADLDWYIRAGGDNTNGGGFDDTVAVPGTNYADQDAVKYSGVNLTVDAVTNTKVIPDGHTPDATDEGNVVRISTNAGGWTYGYYTITDQDGTAWTLDRSPAGVGVSGGAWRMGGAFANIAALAATVGGTIGGSGSPSVPSPLAAGHQVNIRGAGTDNPSVVDYDWDDGYITVASGSNATGAIKWVGYNGRPLIGHRGLVWFTPTYHYFYNLSFKQTTSTYLDEGIIGQSAGGNNVSVVNCYFDQNGVDGYQLRINGYVWSVIGCWFRNNGSTTAGTKPAIYVYNTYPTFIFNCVFEDIRGYALYGDTCIIVFVNNIVHACRGGASYPAIKIVNATYGSFFLNNTFDDNDGGDVNLNNAAAVALSVVANNIFSNSTGAASLNCSGSTAVTDRVKMFFDYNNFYNNATDRTNVSAGSNDTALDPQYTAAASGDWSVGPNMKAIAFPKNKAFTAASVSTYVDQGAVQRQEPILFGGASNLLTLSKETGANARGGSGTCAKLDPKSTTGYGYWDFFVYVPAAEFKLSFYYKSYHTTSAWNGTLKVSMWDSDNYTEDPPALLNSVDVSGTYDATYRLWESAAKTAAAEGLCRVRIEIKDGSDNGGVYIDDIAVTET